MWKVREIADKVTNVVMNYTEIEAKVREATNDDPWGPTGTIRHELAQATFSYDQFPEVMGMLWKRIAENKRSPRRIYKSLLLVHHLLLNGSDRVIRASTDRLYEIRQLQDYHVVYEPGFNITSIIPVDEYKDGEMNVRVKAKEIVELIQDEERLREDRKKAKKNRDKYVGIGSDRPMSKWNDFDEDLQFPRQTSSTSNSKYDDFDGDDDGSIGIGSKSKSSNKSPDHRDPPKSALNFKVKSQDVANDEDDFNPRANESIGKISSIGSSKKAPVVFSSSPTGGGDFADFQSAFGKSGNGANFATANNFNSSTSTAIHDGQDLFGGTSAQSISTLSSNQTVDLLGLEFNPSTTLQSSSAQQSHVIGSNSTSTSMLSSSFDSFQGFQGVGNQHSASQSLFMNFAAPPPTVAPSPIFSPTFPAFQQQQPLPQQIHQQQNILFGSSTDDNLLGVGLLQPQQVNNNINNNHVHEAATGKVSVNKKALEGTTWSDLNISIDDLSLSAKSKPMAQPTMNQLLSSPTRSKPF